MRKLSGLHGAFSGMKSRGEPLSFVLQEGGCQKKKKNTPPFKMSPSASVAPVCVKCGAAGRCVEPGSLWRLWPGTVPSSAAAASRWTPAAQRRQRLRDTDHKCSAHWLPVFTEPLPFTRRAQPAPGHRLDVKRSRPDSCSGSPCHPLPGLHVSRDAGLLTLINCADGIERKC